MDASFERLLKLVRKTGDPMVVLGSSGEDPCVILPIDRYEAFTLSSQGQSEKPAILKEKPKTISESPLEEPPAPEPVPPSVDETQFYLEPVE